MEGGRWDSGGGRWGVGWWEEEMSFFVGGWVYGLESGAWGGGFFCGGGGI